jgi:hypothetical protein
MSGPRPPGQVRGWRQRAGHDRGGKLPAPRSLERAEVSAVPQLFAEAAQRAVAAGFDIVEIHAATGISSTSFSRHSPTGEGIDTAGASRTACVCS